MSRARFRSRMGARIDRAGQRTWLIGLIVVAIGGTIAIGAALSTNGAPGPPSYTFSMKVPPEAPPLKVAAPVRVAGRRAGSVYRVTPQRDGLLVEVSVTSRYAPLGRDARVAVRSTVGTSLTYLAVKPGDASDPIPNGGALPAQRVDWTSSLPQALETFDAEVRAALQTNLTVPAQGISGRGGKINESLGKTRESVEDAADLARATASRRPGAVRESLQNYGTVADALTGTRPDDLGASISAASRVFEATGRRRFDTARTLRQSAALQAIAPDVLDDLDRTTSSATVLLEQAAPLLRNLQAQGDDVEAILEAGPALQRDAAALLKDARPVLATLSRSTVLLRRSTLGIEPTLKALTDFSAGATPYRPEILALAAGLTSATKYTFDDEFIVRVSTGLGCHVARNARPAPGQVSKDRQAC